MEFLPSRIECTRHRIRLKRFEKLSWWKYNEVNKCSINRIIATIECWILLILYCCFWDEDLYPNDRVCTRCTDIIIWNYTYFGGHFVLELSSCRYRSTRCVYCWWLWLIGWSWLVYIHTAEYCETCPVLGGQRRSPARVDKHARAWAPKGVTGSSGFPLR